MVMARAGKWRHRITVQTPTYTADAHGQKVQTWTSSTTKRWGNIEPLTGNELWNSQRVQSEVTHRIEMRYGPLFTAQRLQAKGKTFQILSIKDIGEKQAILEIMCKEVESDSLPVVNDEGDSVFNDANSQVYVAR